MVPVAVAIPGHRLEHWGVQVLVGHLHEWSRVEGLAGPLLGELLLHLLAEGIDANAVDVELDAGFGLILPELLGAVEDTDDRVAHAQVLLHGHELVEGVGDTGHDRGAPAGQHLEAPPLHALLVHLNARG